MLFFVIPRVGLAALPFRGRVRAAGDRVLRPRRARLVRPDRDRRDGGDARARARGHAGPRHDPRPALAGDRLRRLRRPGVDGGRARAPHAPTRGRRAGRLPARRPARAGPRAVPRGLPRADRDRRDLRGRPRDARHPPLRAAHRGRHGEPLGGVALGAPSLRGRVGAGRRAAGVPGAAARAAAERRPRVRPLSRAAAARAPRGRPRPRGGGRRRERLRGGGQAHGVTSPGSIATRSRWSATTQLDPVEEFLFVRRSGNCEYFAAALAVMLRTLGIPSRVVGGFQRGEWNPYGRYFTVRLRDAHSWVEAYIHGAGWVALDPSPRAEAEAAWRPGGGASTWTRCACAGTATSSTGACATRWRWPRPCAARPPSGACPSARCPLARRPALGSRRRGRRRAARGRRLDVAPPGRPPGERSRPPSPTLLRARALVPGPPRSLARARRDRPRVRRPRLILGAAVRPPASPA